MTLGDYKPYRKWLKCGMHLGYYMDSCFISTNEVYPGKWLYGTCQACRLATKGEFGEKYYSHCLWLHS